MAISAYDGLEISQMETTNATPATVISYNLPLNSVASFGLAVICRDISSGDSAGWQKKVIVKRLTSNAALVGTAVDIMVPQIDLSLTGSDVTVSLSGSSILINVTGIASTTIDWDTVVNVRVLRNV